MRAVLAAGLILAMANAASPALDLVYIAEAAGENDMGIVASGLVAQREINTLSAEAKAILPSGCTPSLKIKIYDHGVDVNKVSILTILPYVARKTGRPAILPFRRMKAHDDFAD